jgi:hypothetical protein
LIAIASGISAADPVQTTDTTSQNAIAIRNSFIHPTRKTACCTYDEPGCSARNHRTRAGAFLYYTRLEYLPNLIISVAQGEIGLAELRRYHHSL